MSVQITTLSENTAGRAGLLAEWGLSVMVETGDIKVLLDTCSSFSVTHNAPLLGIDLSAIDKIVLSHGHYDHTGGLREVLSKTGPVDIIAHPDVWDKKYIRFGEHEAYIGIPFSREELEGMGASFKLSPEPVWITNEIVTTGEIPMVEEYESIEANFYVKKAGKMLPDPFSDDRALVIVTDAGLVVILGCAHRGAINTLRHAQQITGVEQVHTVVGGTHLLRASEERVLITAAAFQEMGARRVGVSHCTGLHSAMLLAQQLGEAFFFNNTGTSITVP